MQVLIDGIERMIQMEKELEKGKSIDRLLPPSVVAEAKKNNKSRW